MPTFLRRLGVASAAVFALAGPAARADPQIWRIHGAGGVEVTLFGSVHLLSASTDWFTPALAAELARADRLWFEIPLDASAQAQAQAGALRLGVLPAGETLSSRLSPHGRQRLAAAATELGVPLATLDRLQPWLAEAAISVAYFQKVGARQDLGVEQELDHAAPATVERGSMETVDDQIAALAGGTPADQLASLEQTLKDVRDDPQSFRRLVDAWSRGDVRRLVREELEPMRRDSPSLYKRLVVDRNRRWVAELDALLKAGRPGRTFVVVGVGHLIGSESVPALLRREGVRVEGP